MKRENILLTLMFLGFVLIAGVYYFALYKKDAADRERFDQITYKIKDDTIIAEPKND